MTIAESLKQEGMQQGTHQTQLDIARSMLAMGMSEEILAKATKLPADEVKTLH